MLKSLSSAYNVRQYRFLGRENRDKEGKKKGMKDRFKRRSPKITSPRPSFAVGEKIYEKLHRRRKPLSVPLPHSQGAMRLWHRGNSGGLHRAASRYAYANTGSAAQKIYRDEGPLFCPDAANHGCHIDQPFGTLFVFAFKGNPVFQRHATRIKQVRAFRFSVTCITQRVA